MSIGTQTTEVTTLTDLRNKDLLGFISSVKLWTNVFARTLGRAAAGDGGGQQWYWDPLSTLPDDGGATVQLGFGTPSPIVVGRWRSVVTLSIDPRRFGAAADVQFSSAITRQGTAVILGPFVAADAGKNIFLQNGGAGYLKTTILAASAGRATLAASVTGSAINQTAVWFTDASAGINAAISACPEGATVAIPPGNWGLDSGIAPLTKGLTIEGAGFRRTLNGLQDWSWYRASQATGTSLYCIGTGDGIAVDGSVLRHSLRVRDIAIIGPGFGASNGLNICSGNIGGTDFQLDRVMIGNWGGVGLRSSQALDSKYGAIQVSACGTGVQFTSLGGLSANNDVHGHQLNIAACTIGLDLQQGTGIYVHGAAIQGCTLGARFGQGELMWVVDAHFESNTHDFAIDSTGGSNLASGLLRCHMPATETTPTPVIGSGVRGFAVRDCTATGKTFDVTNINDMVIENTQYVTTVGDPLGISIIGGVNAVNGQSGVYIFASAPTPDIVYAAAITPAPTGLPVTKVAALTGPMTVNAPAYIYAGQRMTFIFVQDATGGRNVTFNSAYKTAYSNAGNTAGKRCTVEFFVQSATEIIQAALSGWF